MILQHVRRAAAAAIASQAAAWQVGNWGGVSIIGNTGEFLGCRMSVRYNSGITLHFIQLRNFSLFIGMSKPEWAMNPNASVQPHAGQQSAELHFRADLDGGGAAAPGILRPNRRLRRLDNGPIWRKTA